jgi:hypothetical protein
VVGLQDVVASRYETLFLSDQGRVLFQTDFAADRIEFDRAGRTVLLADKRQLAIVQPTSARELARHRISDGSHRLLDASISEGGEFAVALSAQTRFDRDAFVHESIRIHELVRRPDESYAHRRVARDGRARHVGVAAHAAGVVLRFDGSIFHMPREP